MRILSIAIFICTIIISYIFLTSGERPLIFMATTTTHDSGLLSVLLPELEKDTGLKIKSIAFGTGKVLRSAEDGNADVILVHDPIAEEQFMKEGYGSERLAIMRNNFVLVGPSSDPADIRSSSNAREAFQKIAESNSIFISRADQSGTHNAEMMVWKLTGYDPNDFSNERYIQTGTGMGRTLNVAIEKNAYVLTDNATWITYENKGDHNALFSNDELLSNTYHLITVSNEKHPHISAQNQKLVVDWFKSEKARSVIENFKPSGQQLYFPIPRP